MDQKIPAVRPGLRLERGEEKREHIMFSFMSKEQMACDIPNKWNQSAVDGKNPKNDLKTKPGEGSQYC